MLSLEGGRKRNEIDSPAGREDVIEVEACEKDGARRSGNGDSLTRKMARKARCGSTRDVAVIHVCDDGEPAAGKEYAEQGDMTLEELRLARLKRFGN